MGRFQHYYNKHSNEALQNARTSLTSDTQANKARTSLIEKCLAVPQPKEVPLPPSEPKTPPPTPSSNEPKTDEELEAFYQNQMIQHQKESYEGYFNWLETLPSTWEKRIQTLEQSRQKYNQKRGWSADDLYEAEAIDSDIAYCKQKLQEVLDDVDEFWSDSDSDSDC